MVLATWRRARSISDDSIVGRRNELPRTIETQRSFISLQIHTDDKKRYDGIMGETEEKETGAAEPQTAETEEPKETDSMLKKEEDKATEEVKKSKENLIEEEPKKNGDEIINVPEEEKKDEEKKTDDTEKPKTEAPEEGREVKPRKIPFGGFKLPGFFTRNKKPEDSDGAEGGLLEKVEGDVEKGAGAEEEAPEETPAAESRFNRNLLNYLRFKNPFAKKDGTETVPAEEEEGEKKAGDESRQTEEPTEKKDSKEGEEEKKPEGTEETPKGEGEEAKPADETAPAEKKSILSSIRLPHIALSNLIPKRLRPGQRASEDLELGNGPRTKAGLASMETLDDSLKDTDSKDQTDKAVNGKMADEDLETVKLDDKEEKPKDKAAEAAEDQKPKPILDRIRAYQCTVGECD